MAFGLPTDLPTILASITTALTTSPFALPSTEQPFDPSQVMPTLAKDDVIEKMLVKDQFLAIRPVGFPVDRAEVTGGGIYQTVVVGNLEYMYYGKFLAVPQIYDLQRLVDASFGLLYNQKAIMGMMQMFVPLDPLGSGNCILCEPQRLVRFDIAPRKTMKDGWTRIDSVFEIKFVFQLPTFS